MSWDVGLGSIVHGPIFMTRLISFLRRELEDMDFMKLLSHIPPFNLHLISQPVTDVAY